MLTAMPHLFVTGLELRRLLIRQQRLPDHSQVWLPVLPRLPHLPGVHHAWRSEANPAQHDHRGRLSGVAVRREQRLGRDAVRQCHRRVHGLHQGQSGSQAVGQSVTQ